MGNTFLSQKTLPKIDLKNSKYINVEEARIFVLDFTLKLFIFVAHISW